MQSKKPISEEELIEGCKAGDPRAQESLYKLFYGYAMGIGMRYLSNRDDSLEVVNDSFIKVFKAIQFYNNTQPFKAWLRRIIINTAIDQQRKNLRHSGHSDIDEAFHVSTSATAISSLSAKDIIALIARLPEVQRMVFNLYEIDGYSHDEIGTMLNIPGASSRVYLSRAKEKLRKDLDRKEGQYAR